MERIIGIIKNNIKTIVIIVLVLIIICLTSYTFLFKKDKEIINQENIEIETNNEEIVDSFFVDLKGEVKKPGVYEVSSTTKVNDLILMGGGLTKNGTTSNINLSKKLNESMVVIISSKKDLQKEAVVISNECTCKEVDITPCVTNNESVVEAEKSSDDNPTVKVSINTATKEELMTLSGIGESKAINIINYRDTNGLFSNINDLLNVSGIGTSIFAQIKENITL